MNDSPRIAVVGASGVVGSSVTEALRRRGATVVAVPAPRLTWSGPGDPTEFHALFQDAIDEVAPPLEHCDAVVNAAGLPDASSRDEPALNGANGALPGVIGAAASKAGTPRMVHVSSAVVQGRIAVLDDSDSYDPFSTYASSKILGEKTVREFGPGQTVVYRPPSVHDSSRRVTRMTARIARSRLAMVAAPGTGNTPQAHIDNVGDIVAFLALCDEQPPTVVTHPSEGFTTASLMETLGGHAPFLLPRCVARVAVSTAERLGKRIPPVAANARRVEMIWFGQGQAESWAPAHGWTPRAGIDRWQELGHFDTATRRGHGGEPRPVS